MKLNFCMLLDIHKSKKFTKSIYMGVARPLWENPKRCQIVKQFRLKNELSYEFDFVHAVRHSWKLKMYSIISNGRG